MRAILLLGSNLNTPQTQLALAREHLSAICNTINTSSIYITAAWGNTSQADFYNQAVEIEFSISPSILMKKIIEIELIMGRRRINKWEPRIIDIDIICIDDLVIDEDELKVPHPLMQNRMFVLIPFEELNKQWVHPILNKNINQLLLECDDKLEVRKLIIE